jgi:hypothetical protein
VERAEEEADQGKAARAAAAGKQADRAGKEAQGLAQGGLEGAVSGSILQGGHLVKAGPVAVLANQTGRPGADHFLDDVINL